MIDFILAAEFDINSGVCLTDYYPQKGEIKNSYIIASYMLPDGIHKHDSDISVFTSKIQFSDLKESKEMDENISSEKFFFYNIIKNKKDNNIKRGACVRSLAIASKSIQLLYVFHEILNFYLEEYSLLQDIKEEKNQKALTKLLKQAFTKTNLFIKLIGSHKQFKVRIELPVYKIPTHYIKRFKPLQFALTNSFLINIKEHPKKHINLMRVSLLKFVQKFGKKTMNIYNAIMNQQRILFFGQNWKVEEVCGYVCACVDLVSPYNVIGLLHPYTHLLDDNVMKQKTYIAGVTNPIFKSKVKD